MHIGLHLFARFPPLETSAQESVVRRVLMAHMGLNRQVDRLCRKRFGVSATPDAVRVLAAGVLCDAKFLSGRTARILLPDLRGKGLHETAIRDFSPRCFTQPACLPQLGIGQTFFLGLVDGRPLHEIALALVALACFAPLDHEGAQTRILTRPTGERGISRG